MESHSPHVVHCHSQSSVPAERWHSEGGASLIPAWRQSRQLARRPAAPGVGATGAGQGGAKLCNTQQPRYTWEERMC